MSEENLAVNFVNDNPRNGPDPGAIQENDNKRLNHHTTTPVCIGEDLTHGLMSPATEFRVCLGTGYAFFEGPFPVGGPNILSLLSILCRTYATLVSIHSYTLIKEV